MTNTMKQIGVLAKISEEILGLQHELFQMTLENDILYFTCSKEALYDLYCRNYISYAQQESGERLSFIEIIYSHEQGNSLGNAAGFAERLERNLERYNPKSARDNMDLLMYFAVRFNIYYCENIKTIEDIKEPVPLPLFCDIVKKTDQSKREVSIESDGYVFAGILKNIYIQRTMFGINAFALLSIVSKGINGYVEGMQRIQIPALPFVKSLEDLGITPLTEKEKIKFHIRGMKYADLTKEPSYVHYKGDGFVYGRWEEKRITVKSRIMIDGSSMKMINSNISDGWYYGDMFGYDCDEDCTVELSEQNIWMASPVVYGFVFGNKEWCRMSVNGVEQIKFSENAFEELIIPQTYKDIFIASLTNPMPSLDSIEDKGEGKIFLLYGAPGVGKTMTAESVAEYLQKPLYFVSVGELGVNPSELEHALERVMSIASSWDAIILLDEVDVFAVNRDGASIERNAMTAIFLRMLERYSGIMFMTTNLLDNLDPAFLSRSTAVVEYKSLDVAERETIWTKIFAKAEQLGAVTIDEDVYKNIPAFAAYDINGRVIKNTIRLAYSLALASDDKVITTEHINSVLELKKASM